MMRLSWPQAMLRRLISSALAIGLLVVMATHDAAMQAPGDNPIVLENQQPGSLDWGWSLLGDDVNGQIKGYASATSVMQNGSIRFHVSVKPAQTFTIDFYRIGWYGGYGARHRLQVGPLVGIPQTPCLPEPTTGLIACNWNPSYTLTVPSDWTSGVYTARLTNAQGYQNYVIFIVRDGRPAPFLYQHSVTTDHAYNNYPNDGVTGKSLYTYNSFGPNTVSGNPRAVKVSFDRPYADSGFGNLLYWEINLIRWLERSGYDVTYSTNVDTHANGSELLNHRAFLSTGHDEYWSKEMFDAVEAARDAGVNLAFFGANTAYWQVRFESSAAGVPNRTLVGYKQNPASPIDPVQGPTTSTYFREPPVNRPEQTLVGIQFVGELYPNADYVVTNSSHWVYSGTGFRDGDVVRGILGHEADSFMPNYPSPNVANHTLLSQSPFTEAGSGATVFANSSIYQAPSGAWVFATGTLAWCWALDDFQGLSSQILVDSRIQRTTANLLDAFLNGLAPTITSFAPTSGSVGTSVTITGTHLTGTSSVTFNGTAANFSVTSNTTIQTAVPAGATTGPVRVTANGGTTTSTAAFTVITAPPPTITSFTPTNGPVGTTVIINGTNFSGATAVRFNGASASFSVVSGTTIQATVPTGATTGPLSVTTSAGTATSSTNFAVTPRITSFTPTSGRVGSSVTIIGSNFTGATAVRFNGAAASFSVTSATSIQATVPATATTGPLSVTASGGTATSSSAFTVRRTLIVNKTGIRGGTVSSNPGGINCGGSCSADFNHGTVVSLTASPAFLSVFAGWSGCDAVSGNTCTVALNASKTVVARFLP